MADSRDFRYLNQAGRWAGFDWQGLELGDDGALRLDALPRLDGAAPAGLAALPTPEAPAGVAAGPDGTLYFSDPSGHRLLRIDGCAGDEASGAACPSAGGKTIGGGCAVDSQVLPCVGGPSDVPGAVHVPRGLLYHPARQAIAVADSANHRIELFSTDGFQLQDIWGRWGGRPGRFKTPTALATDALGSVYVVDWGNQRVQKFDALGRVLAGFWRTAHQSAPQLRRPIDVAAQTYQARTEVFVLDAEQGQVFVFDADGNQHSAFGTGLFGKPMGLAVAGDALYVGDNARAVAAAGADPTAEPVRRVLRFKRVPARTPGRDEWLFVGEAIGYEGPIAALALDGQGGLWVHNGTSRPPLRLAARGGFGRYGVLWGGPVNNPSFRTEQWHRLKSAIEPLAPDTHFRLFYYRLAKGKSDQGDARLRPPSSELASGGPPDDKAWAAATAEPAMPASEALQAKACLPEEDQPAGGCNQWYKLPLDVAEGLIAGGPGEDLWIGAELSGEGLASPILSQLRLDFDYPTLLKHLPAIYQADDQARNFLARFVTLFESLLGDVEWDLRHLAGYFDPWAAPADWLAWLASWLALDIDEAWDEPMKRQAISEAYAAYARRGTVEGLRAAVKRFAGLDVRIQEPLQHASWWLLAGDEPADGMEAARSGESSVLEFTTMLAPAEAQGAVVGTTAVLDASHLITEAEFGAPLFEDLAYQFTVLAYRGPGSSAEGRAALRAIIDREKPAHTTYHLCVVEPRLRIGFQARIGVDTVIAGPPQPTGLDPDEASVGRLVLGGEPAGRVGEASKIGVTTRLGSALG